MTADEKYMLLALELAEKGIGSVEPNPVVGAVLVKNGEIIGQGFHEEFGAAHAEINAIADCKAEGNNPAGATMYVTLEPCCHVGKTGPCTDAIIKANIAKVIAACRDPSEDASGRGFEILRQAGINVEIGLCRADAELINAPFFKYVRTKLPWVILKWAQSIDSRLAWKSLPAEGHYISSPSSRKDVHMLRRRVQAILVGINTVMSDNPQLTVRLDGGHIERPPLRVVLDSHLKLPWDCHLITTPDAPTVIVTTNPAAQAEPDKLAKLRQAGIEIMCVNEKNRRCDIVETLEKLGSRGVEQLLVEGGPAVLSAFLEQKLADEICVYIAPKILGKEGTASISDAMEQTVSAVAIRQVKIAEFDGDVRLTGLIADA